MFEPLERLSVRRRRRASVGVLLLGAALVTVATGLFLLYHDQPPDGYYPWGIDPNHEEKQNIVFGGICLGAVAVIVLLSSLSRSRR